MKLYKRCQNNLTNFRGKDKINVHFNTIKRTVKDLKKVFYILIFCQKI